MCRAEENLGPSARFCLIDGTGRELFEGGASRIVAPGATGPWHYAGDFSPFRVAGGDFQIRFEAGNRVATSARFGLGSRILWRLTKPLVIQLLRFSRATRPNHEGQAAWHRPGILPEDGRFYDVGGGWFDCLRRGGMSLASGARALMGLVSARAVDPRDQQVRAELIWGAEWLRRLMIRYPASGQIVAAADETGQLTLLGHGEKGRDVCFVAGYLYARISEALGDVDLLRRGERFWAEHRDRTGEGANTCAAAAMLLSEAALLVATLEPRYLAAAERHAEMLIDTITRRAGTEARTVAEVEAHSYAAAALAEFAQSDPQNPITPRAKMALGEFLDSWVEAARPNAFGLVPLPEATPPEEAPLRRAEEAWAALAAYRVTGRAAYVELAVNAINSLMGLSPNNLSLLRGAGVNEEGESAMSVPDGAMVPQGAGPDTRILTGGTAAYLMALTLL